MRTIPLSRRAYVVRPRCRGRDHVLRTARMLDEHLLHESIRFFHVIVVMTFTDVAELRELLDAKLPTAFTERLEHVLCLTSEDDVADESQVIALSRSVGKLP